MEGLRAGNRKAGSLNTWSTEAGRPDLRRGPITGQYLKGGSAVPALCPPPTLSFPQCPRTSSPRPIPPPPTGALEATDPAYETSPTTGAVATSGRGQRPLPQHATAVRRERRGPEVGVAGCRRGQSNYFLARRLRLGCPPATTILASARKDRELEADREPGCCPCQHPPPGRSYHRWRHRRRRSREV